jgi:type I restriction enzyme S subunit
MNRALPKGWVEIELGQHVYIAGRIGWRGLKADEYTQTGPIFLSVPNLNYGDEVDFTKVNHISQGRYDESPEIKLNVGDTLLVKDGAGIGKLGYVANLPSSATVNSSLLVVRPNDELLVDKYVFYYLKGPQFQQIALERITGSATPHLFQKDIKRLNVLVPPKGEQRRIVSKLEKLLGQMDTCQQRLVKIPMLLKRFRQSILAAACSGRLTADWREENAVVTNEAHEELPIGWKPVCVGNLIESLKYGTAQKCGYEKRGVPVLRIPNVVNGTIDHADLKYAELPAKELDQLCLRPGDILLIRSNGSVSLVGKCALVRRTEAGFAYAGYLIRLRPNRTYIEPEFLNLVLGSFDIRLQIELEARSTSGVNNINGEEVRALRLSLPPLAEQQEIVRRVEGLFALADQIEARFEKARAQVEKLTPSLLARAFRGELVPQDPNDEPASVLLERIKKQQNGNESPKEAGNALTPSLPKERRGRSSAGAQSRRLCLARIAIRKDRKGSVS